MLVAIAVITGFQVFWLRENYFKEKRNLEFRSSVVFKETVRRLQSKRLNLDQVYSDSNGKLRVEVLNEPLPAGFPVHPAEELTDVLNDVTIKVSDSLERIRMDMERRTPTVIIKGGEIGKDSLRRRKGNMVISMSETYSKDSGNRRVFFRKKWSAP